MIRHPAKTMKVWSWRQLILEAAGLSPTTRHVLLTLSVYMNDLGEGCFPTIDTLSANTGLTCRAVITALNMAEISGFIEKEQHGFAGSQWRRNEYRARLPDDTGLHYGIIPHTKVASDRMKNLARKKVAAALVSGDLIRQPCLVCGLPADAHHPDYAKALEVVWLCRDHHRRLHAVERGEEKNVVNVVHHPSLEGGERRSNRGEPASHRVVKDVHTNSPLNSPKNSPSGGFLEKDVDKSPFSIERLLSEAGLSAARANAPGWDVYYLMRIFDQSVRTGVMKTPEKPDRAFPAWCKSYTKGKRP